MKKSYLLTLLFLFSAQSVCADSFFRVLAAHIKGFVKRDASSEQKERLTKLAAVLIISASITLYCVAAARAILNGDEVPPIKLPSLKKPPGPKGRRKPSRKKPRRRKSDSSLRKPSMHKLPELAPSESMRNFFDQPTQSPHSALREDPIKISEKSRADTGSVRLRGNFLAGLEEPEPLFS